MAKYFKTGATTWNSAANWSTSSISGSDTGGVPTNTDDVLFQLGSGNCNVDVAAVCGTLNFTGYTGTLTMTNGITVGSGSAGGSITLSSGMTIASTGGIASNNTSTLTSNGKTWPNSVTLSGASKTFTLADAWTIGGTVTLNGTTLETIVLNGTLTATTLTLSTNTTFSGAYGFIVGTLTAAAASGLTFILASGVSYQVTSSVTIYATSGNSASLKSSSTPTQAIFTFTGSTQDVGFCNPTDIDSSAAQTLWSYGSTINNTKNWLDLSLYPFNVSNTFVM